MFNNTHKIDDEQPYILEVEDAFSAEECMELIDRIESLSPKAATVNTASGVVVDTDVRNNDRVIFEDEELAQSVVERIGEQAPEEIHGMRLVGANERFRCYKYQPGMRFKPHADGSFIRNESERSVYSVLIYLNDDCEGGETTFLTQPLIKIKPETGKVCLFQHPILHEGSIVTEGVKYVARTDLMYSSKGVVDDTEPSPVGDGK